MTDIHDIDVSGAKLPSTYNAAKRALSQCSSLDECKDWSDRAAALASYAKQSQDEQLEKMAKRIRARATRRAGELLKQIDARGAHMKSDGAVISQKQAAADAGMSERQRVTATRLASVPEDDFEDMVEADATVTEIAKAGTQARDSGEGDRIARMHAKALSQAMMDYVAVLSRVDPVAEETVAAMTEVQRIQLRGLIHRIDSIHDKLVTS